MRQAIVFCVGIVFSLLIAIALERVAVGLHGQPVYHLPPNELRLAWRDDTCCWRTEYRTTVVLGYGNAHQVWTTGPVDHVRLVRIRITAGSPVFAGLVPHHESDRLAAAPLEFERAFRFLPCQGFDASEVQLQCVIVPTDGTHDLVLKDVRRSPGDIYEITRRFSGRPAERYTGLNTVVVSIAEWRE